MRRRVPLRDRPLPRGLLQGREFSRLVVLCGMLVVMVMLIGRARDPDMWTWLTGEEKAESRKPKGEKAAAAPVPLPALPRETVVEGPTDLDPDQQEAIQEELSAITDKQPLERFEMLAYWRQVRWTRAQSFDVLRRRAADTVTYADLWERPEKFRGKLVSLSLHLRRARVHDDLPDVKLHVPGQALLNEAWGWDDRSHPFNYAVVCPEFPEGMPVGHHIEEDAEFVGYFLKLIPFVDREAKSRATPLLIGRLRWKPPKPAPTAESQLKTVLPVLLIGGLAVIAVVFGGAILARRRPARAARGAGRGPGEAAPSVESWLDQADEGSSTAISPDGHPESNGNGSAFLRPDWLDPPGTADR